MTHRGKEASLGLGSRVGLVPLPLEELASASLIDVHHQGYVSRVALVRVAKRVGGGLDPELRPVTSPAWHVDGEAAGTGHRRVDLGTDPVVGAR